jgi:hypothetical protein
MGSVIISLLCQILSGISNKGGLAGMIEIHTIHTIWKCMHRLEDILKWILRKRSLVVCTRFLYLRTGTKGGLLWTWYWTLGLHKRLQKKDLAPWRWFPRAGAYISIAEAGLMSETSVVSKSRTELKSKMKCKRIRSLYHIFERLKYNQ